MADKDRPIKKDMSMQEIFEKFPETVEVFHFHGLHCIGCFAAAYETLEEGAKAHGMDLEKLMDDLNAAVKKK